MCSRYLDTQCCVCCRFLDKSNDRIIVEICGHQKCRECFIKEQDGCSLCSQKKLRSSHNIVNGCDGNVDKFYSIVSNNKDNQEIIYEDKAAKIVDYIDKIAEHIIETKDAEDVIRYKCTICQKNFKSRNNRKYHLFCDKTRSKPYKCNQCDKQFITVAHLNYHQTTHSTDKHFSCQHCQKVYSGEISLKKHLRKHQNEFKYQCTQCDEKFLYKEQLNVHQNRHNNIYHVCSECGKRFLIKSNLTKHIQSHSGINRKICPICKNTFSGNSALKTHMLTHSKLKPYQCEKCSKKFIDQRTLERHSKTHLDSEFYECTMCSAKSGRKDNIRRHVRNLHAESNDELQKILQKIFENFSKKKVGSKKDNTIKSEKIMNGLTKESSAACVQQMNGMNSTEAITEATKFSGVVRNIATSVIKFVGRVHDVQLKEKEDQAFESISKQPEKQTSTEDTSAIIQPIDPITDIGVKLPSLEPLSFDQFPAIAPLPLLNTNTNLNVYRQLLSPYLRNKQTLAECSDNRPSKPNNTINKSLKSGPIAINRHPKKMIEKYDIYQQ